MRLLSRLYSPQLLMRFELMEGEAWRGDYSTRRAAMADAELFAAKRGQRVRWQRDHADATTIGYGQPAADCLPFTIRHLAAVPFSRGR